jgi:flavin-dependent dehydrogenase
MTEKDPIEILGAGLSGLTAGIVLARAGRRVLIHDFRADSGARFAGDFQAIENWTSPVDFFEEMRQWGLDTTGFDATEVRSIDVVGTDDRIVRLGTDRLACRIVRRGIQKGSLDQALKADALRHGVEVRYRSRPEPEECHVIATGPRQTSGIVRAELFETDHSDHVTLQFNHVLAPSAYTYLVIVNGIGLIATVLMRRERDVDSYLDATIASYQRHYPNLKRTNLRRITGAGSFALGRNYKEAGRYYVGEAAGLQDCFWGFGIRYAITSGYLAAQEIITNVSYERAVRQRLRPFQIASVANRLVINASGSLGLSILLKAWKWHHRRTGDGLKFVSRIYRHSALHQIIYGCFGESLLAPPVARDAARGMRYLRFRDEKDASC